MSNSRLRVSVTTPERKFRLRQPRLPPLEVGSVSIRLGNKANKAGVHSTKAPGHARSIAGLLGYLRRGFRGQLRRHGDDFTAAATTICNHPALKGRRPSGGLFHMSAHRKTGCFVLSPFLYLPSAPVLEFPAFQFVEPGAR